MTSWSSSSFAEREGSSRVEDDMLRNSNNSVSNIISNDKESLLSLLFLRGGGGGGELGTHVSGLGVVVVVATVFNAGGYSASCRTQEGEEI